MNILDYIKEFKDYIFDESTSWGNVIAKFISLFVFLVFIDLCLNFSYNLDVQNKLSQIEKISRLKSKYKNDSIYILKIRKIENNIFNKEHYSDFLPRILSEISFNQETIDQNINQSNTANKTTKNPIKDVFWMTISSSYLLLIIFPFLLFLPVYDRNARTGNGIAGWVSSLVMIGGMILLITWIAYQIPWPWNNPTWTYIVNFLIHSLFWFLIIKLGNDKNKKTNANTV